jgi:hypothetical protein
MEAAMPEQLTKHPDITLQVLRSAGATCGQGAPQEILTQCPVARFCKLPGGELCIYGVPEATRMTQVTAAEWRAVLGRGEQPAHEAAAAMPAHTADIALGSAAGLLAGLVIGALLVRRRRDAPPG